MASECEWTAVILLWDKIATKTRTNVPLRLTLVTERTEAWLGIKAVAMPAERRAIKENNFILLLMWVLLHKLRKMSWVTVGCSVLFCSVLDRPKRIFPECMLHQQPRIVVPKAKMWGLARVRSASFQEYSAKRQVSQRGQRQQILNGELDPKSFPTQNCSRTYGTHVYDICLQYVFKELEEWTIISEIIQSVSRDHLDTTTKRPVCQPIFLCVGVQ